MADRKVFISYAQPGQSYGDWLKPFAESLRRRGFEVFDEREALDWSAPEVAGETLREQLRSSDVVVFLLDAGNVSSPSFLFEYGASSVLDKPVVAVLADGVEPGALPVDRLRDRAIPKSTPEQTAAELDRLAIGQGVA